MISGKILRDAIISGANNINNQRREVLGGKADISQRETGSDHSRSAPLFEILLGWPGLPRQTRRIPGKESVSLLYNFPRPVYSTISKGRAM